jgi:hypothetical protein
MRVQRIIGLAIVSLTASLCLADWNDTSTGIDLKSLPPFPLTKVRAGLLRAGDRVSFDGLTATEEAPPPPDPWDEVVLRGKGKSGKAWAVHFAGGAFDQVFRGDLDGNGTQDYVVFGGEPFFNGNLAAPYHMTVLLLDKDGLPSPFETSLYDDLGPLHVVDLRHDGRALLVLARYDEQPWDVRAAAVCSGHWKTRLYQSDALNWSEFRGPAGNRVWPFIQKWTYVGTHCPVEAQPYPWKEAVEEPSFDSPDFIADRLTKVSATSRTVSLMPPGCEVVVPLLVYDQPTQREIALGSPFGAYQEKLLDRILADKAKIRVRGFSRFGKQCGARQFWASK